MQFYTKLITGTGNLEPLSGMLSAVAGNRNPRNIRIIIPKGHKMTMQQVAGPQWSTVGQSIEVDNQTGGASIFFDFNNWEADEGGSVLSHIGYANLWISFNVNEFGYLFVTY